MTKYLAVIRAGTGGCASRPAGRSALRELFTALKRGEIWWADLGAYRPREQTGRRPVVIWQSDALTQALQSVLVVPLTTNLDRRDSLEPR